MRLGCSPIRRSWFHLQCDVVIAMHESIKRAHEVLNRIDADALLDDIAVRQTRSLLDPEPEPDQRQVVFKEHRSPRRFAEPVMSEHDTERWNAWAHREIDAHLMPVIDGLTDEIAAITGSLERRVKELEQHVGQLTADLHVAQAALSGKLVEIGNKGKSNAA